MDWADRVAQVLGIEAWDGEERDLVLDLARDVAHGTERRYAPLTAYALGVAVGMVGGERAVSSVSRHERLGQLAEALTAAAGDDESEP